jgi:hypothetical protein
VAFIGAVAFFGGGFSELYTVVQAALLLLALAAALGAARFTRRPGDGRRAAGIITVALAATVLALLTLSFAPGTIARRATFPAAPSVNALVWNSWQYSLWFLRDAAAQQGGLLLAAAGAGVVTSLAWPARPGPTSNQLLAGLLVLPIVTFGLLMAAYAPAFYAVLYLPPDRVLIIHWFIFAAALFAWGFIAGQAIKLALLAAPGGGRMPAAVWAGLALTIAGLAAVPPARAATLAASGREAARNYAATWDSFDRQLRAAHAAGASSVALPLLENPGGIDNYSADPELLSNYCARIYYGVSVTAFEPPPVPGAIELAHRQPLDANIGGAVRVLGYRLEQAEVRAGGTLTVTIYWQPTATTEKPQTVFLHLYDPAAGRSLAQVDRAPGDGGYPTSLWIQGRVFADRFTLVVPAGAAPTEAVLILGLYDLATGERLPVTGRDAGPAGSHWVQFGRFTVAP